MHGTLTGKTHRFPERLHLVQYEGIEIVDELSREWRSVVHGKTLECKHPSETDICAG
jgi:hypothetical protein